MQAIILAAGMGKRLGALTRDNTKCMVSVNGKTLIDRVIQQLSGRGLTRLIMVIGYKGQILADYIGHRYDDKIKIEYITNPIYDRTNNIYSLALAREEMCKDDTILLESDLIFEDSILDMLFSHPDKDLALVAKYEPWMDGTMVCIDSERNILNFVPKTSFRYQDSGSYYKTVNIYKFSRRFSTDVYVPFLEAYCKVLGTNEYYEQVLSVLTMIHTSTLKALPIGSRKWYEIDDMQDLDIASSLFCEGAQKSLVYKKRYGGYWRFPHLLDFCYLVNPFFPTERMREEIRANFDSLLENYPSGMDVNSMLAGKCFSIRQEYVVAGNGAAELIKCFIEQHVSGKVGVVFPTFDEYPNRIDDDRIVPFIPDSPDFSYTADDLMKHFSGKGLSLLLLINPDNPSGNFISPSDVLRLERWCCASGIRLLLDESFVDFTDGGGNSLLRDDILEEHPSMTIIKSISKSYGVPGLRLGVLASSDCDMIHSIKKQLSIWNINSFAEYFLQVIGKYESDYRHACDLFREERNRFYGKLQEVPFLEVIPSQANYFLCKVREGRSAGDIAASLLERDILVSNCSGKRNMNGRQLIRLAVRGREDNDRLVEELLSLV